MNSLDNKVRVQIVSALVEGNSIRATSRMTGVSQNTIMKLLADLRLLGLCWVFGGEGLPQGAVSV